MTNLIHRAARTVAAVVFVLPLAAVVWLLAAEAILAQSSGMPALSEMPDVGATDTGGYLTALHRVDVSEFRNSFGAIVDGLHDVSAVSFCSEDERQAYETNYVERYMKLTADLSSGMDQYAGRVHLRSIATAGDGHTFLQAEEAWAKSWFTFAGRVTLALSGAQRQAKRASIVKCEPCPIEVVAGLTPPVDEKGKRHLPGRTFQFHYGRTGANGSYVVDVTVRPGVSCDVKAHRVSFWVFDGVGAEPWYFTSYPATGNPPYPDQLVEEVLIAIDGSMEGADASAPYQADYSENGKVTLVQFRFRNGLLDASNKPLTTTIAWP